MIQEAENNTLNAYVHGRIARALVLNGLGLYRHRQSSLTTVSRRVPVWSWCLVRLINSTFFLVLAFDVSFLLSNSWPQLPLQRSDTNSMKATDVQVMLWPFIPSRKMGLIWKWFFFLKPLVCWSSPSQVVLTPSSVMEVLLYIETHGILFKGILQDSIYTSVMFICYKNLGIRLSTWKQRGGPSELKNTASFMVHLLYQWQKADEQRGEMASWLGEFIHHDWFCNQTKVCQELLAAALHLLLEWAPTSIASERQRSRRILTNLLLQTDTEWLNSSLKTLSLFLYYTSNFSWNKLSKSNPGLLWWTFRYSSNKSAVQEK